jgi:hypothetical protein
VLSGIGDGRFIICIVFQIIIDYIKSLVIKSYEQQKCRRMIATVATVKVATVKVATVKVATVKVATVKVATKRVGVGVEGGVGDGVGWGEE